MIDSYSPEKLAKIEMNKKYMGNFGKPRGQSYENKHLHENWRTYEVRHPLKNDLYTYSKKKQESKKPKITTITPYHKGGV